jgi:hypothetical protein
MNKQLYVQEAYDEQTWYALHVAKNHINWLWDMLEGDPACTLCRENNQVVFDIIQNAYESVQSRLKI